MDANRSDRLWLGLVLRVSIDSGMLFWWANRLIPKTPAPRPYDKVALGLGMGILTGAVLLAAIIPNLAMKIILLPVLLITLSIWPWRYLLDDVEKSQIHLVKNMLLELR